MRRLVLFVAALGLLIPGLTPRAAGLHMHIAAGDYAVRSLDGDLRDMLEERTRCGGLFLGCKDIYRMAQTFPDSYGAASDDEDCTEEELGTSAETIHDPLFLNRYAAEILRECGDVEPLSPCPPLGEEGALTCRLKIDRCERYLAHFMGSIGHTVSDSHLDKFLVNTVSEACELPVDPSLLNGIRENPGQRVAEAQMFTDQHMDVLLARGEWGDPPNSDDWDGLRPSVDGVSLFVADFLKDNVLPPLLPNKCNEKALEAMSKYFSISILGKKACGIVAGGGCSTIFCCPPEDQCNGWAGGPPAPGQVQRWDTGSGGIRDVARELAMIQNTAWRLLKAGRRVKFEWHVPFADRVICVGEDGSGRMRCSRGKAAALLVVGS